LSTNKFKSNLKREIERIDSVGLTKRNEKVIEGFSFSKEYAPKAIINGKYYSVFNSNDYLGLRFNENIHIAEKEASKRYGAGPGAVRFISGTMKVHTELEKEIARFHGKEDAIIFSSAFATNFGALHALIKGQNKDSLISDKTLVVSDELNHRSIIDGIRVAGLAKENKTIFGHKNVNDLKKILETNIEKFDRVLVITDGVFSMIGDSQDLLKMRKVIDEYDSKYREGVLLIVDDAHGVGAYGEEGRGTEEYSGALADILIGTFGKGFGVDGGYVAADKIFIDYLRESAATYIYSNPISPGTAAAALEAVKIVDSEEGKKLLQKLMENIFYFKKKSNENKFIFAYDSEHSIQPLLIGDTLKTKMLVDEMFSRGFVVTNISYPIVPKGKDEIRVQLSASHTKKDIDEFIEALLDSSKKLEII
jgi:glycine C-acetyltransferase